MQPCRVFVGSALVSFCLTFDDARAQVSTELSDGITAGSFPTGIATGSDSDLLGDLIFDGGFEGQNGGTSCATATVLGDGLPYTADTAAAPNWMSSFGPLFSPSNDVVYTFVAGPDVSGFITPIASDYAFAMYLIPSCESGAEPLPIGATATIGTGIDLLASGVSSGNTYYLAVTGTASGGAGANGNLTFTFQSMTFSPQADNESEAAVMRESVRVAGSPPGSAAALRDPATAD